MDKFEKLNKQTRDWNNKNFDRFNQSCNKPYWSESRQNYLNNETYKYNNGQYSKHY